MDLPSATTIGLNLKSTRHKFFTKMNLPHESSQKKFQCNRANPQTMVYVLERLDLDIYIFIISIALWGFQIAPHGICSLTEINGYN